MACPEFVRVHRLPSSPAKWARRALAGLLGRRGVPVAAEPGRKVQLCNVGDGRPLCAEVRAWEVVREDEQAACVLRAEDGRVLEVGDDFEVRLAPRKTPAPSAQLWRFHAEDGARGWQVRSEAAWACPECLSRSSEGSLRVTPPNASLGHSWEAFEECSYTSCHE